MKRWWDVYAVIPGTGKIITLAAYYVKRDHPRVTYHIYTADCSV